MLLLLGVTWLVVARERDPNTRRWILRLAFVAFALRMGAFAFVHFASNPYFFGPDAVGYEYNGARLVSFWNGGPDPGPRVVGSSLSAYYYLNALFVLLLGDSSLAVPMLNLFAGVWTCVVVFHLARRILGEKYAKSAAVITAIFPSLVLWSVLNLRDSLATFFVVFIVYVAVRLRARFSLVFMVGLLLSLFALSQLRDYVAFLVTAGVVLGYFLSARPGKIGSTLFIGILAAVGMAYVLQSVGVFERVIVDDPLSQMSLIREGMGANAGSSYGAGFDTSTFGGAMRFLPFGISFLLFAPFPWAIESPLQMAAMPETLLWYPLFVASLIGIRMAVGEGRAWIPIAVLLCLAFIYALVEGNFGTAYRHRAQFMPIFFVFAGAGVDVIRARFRLQRVQRSGPGRLNAITRVPIGVRSRRRDRAPSLRRR